MGFMVTKEMELLRGALTAKGIEWTDKSATNLADSWVCRTHYSYGGYTWSVIHGYGTYGGMGDTLEITDFDTTFDTCSSGIHFFRTVRKAIDFKF